MFGSSKMEFQKGIFWFCLFYIFLFLDKAEPGIKFSVIQTCTHDYGSVLETIQAVPALMTCAGRCTNVSACRSVMYNVTSSTCILNSYTADLPTLPPDCGITYLAIEGPLPVQRQMSNISGPCNTTSVTSECQIKGSVCITGTCQCDKGLTYHQENGVCTTNRSDCKESDWCFPARAIVDPWTGDRDHLMVEMQCVVTRVLPIDVITRGGLRIAILTDVPAAITSFDFIDKLKISDREVLFINRWNATYPYTYNFHARYDGHVAFWDGHVPVVDTQAPKADCRLIFLF